MPPHPPAAPAPLETYLLGTVELDDVLSLQRRLVYERGERPGGALIVCEHPATISVGRAGSRAHIRPDDEELRAWGLHVRWVNRGGGCLLHLPGQIAAYVVVPLPGDGLDLCGHLDRLRRVLVGLLADFDLGGLARPDAAGVRLGDERVASLGVAVRRGIAYHGFTLNVGPFLAPFGLLAEPGGTPARVTSMEARRQRPAPMNRVREALVGHVERVFGLEQHTLFTSHPLAPRVAPHAAFAACLF